MPHSIRHLAFLTPGNYSEDDPARGIESALRLFQLGETLGFDSGWVRHRHLERGVSSAPTFLAAASQRTSRIGLGVAVIQLGYENLFRLAEDLGMVDVLSAGRLQVGLSVGPPLYGDLLGKRLFDAPPAPEDFSYERVLRLRRQLDGEWLTDEAMVASAAGAQRARVRPHARGLAQRLWYGSGSLASAEWAGTQGLHLLIGNVTRAEGAASFWDAQSRQLDRYRAAREQAAHADPARVAMGRVIVPTDGADGPMRRRCAEWAATRVARTLAPQGPRGTMFMPDLVGPADWIVERLLQDPLLPRVQELRLELPYDLPTDDYAQILEDAVLRIAPALGWQPGRVVRGAPAIEPEHVVP